MNPPKGETPASTYYKKWVADRKKIFVSSEDHNWMMKRAGMLQAVDGKSKSMEDVVAWMVERIKRLEGE